MGRRKSKGPDSHPSDNDADILLQVLTLFTASATYSASTTVYNLPILLFGLMTHELMATGSGGEGASRLFRMVSRGRAEGDIVLGRAVSCVGESNWRDSALVSQQSSHLSVLLLWVRGVTCPRWGCRWKPLPPSLR